MSCQLLWIEHVTVILLVIALLLACVGRLRQRRLGIALWFVASLLITMAYGTQTIFAAYLQFKGPSPSYWFWPALALALAIVAGSLWLSVRGLGPSVFWMAGSIAMLDCAALTAWAGLVYFPTVWIWWLALVFVFLAAAIWLGIKGFRRARSVLTLPAADWPRGRLAIALVVAVALHLATFWNIELAYQQQLAWVRAESGVLALSAAPARVPDCENAAIIYEQVFALLQSSLLEKEWADIHAVSPAARASLSAGHWSDPSGDYSWDLDLKDPELHRFLKSQSAKVALLHKATSKSGCYFEHDYHWMTVIDSLLPSDQILGIRNAAHLLTLDAYANAADGDIRSALHDVNSLFAMSDHLRSQPMVVALAESIQLQKKATEALQHILRVTSVSPDDLAMLSIDAARSYRRSLDRVLRAEEAMRLVTFCWRGTHEMKPKIILPLLHVYRVLITADHLSDNTKLSRQLREAAAKPYYQGRDDWENVCSRIRQARGYLISEASALADFNEIVAVADARQQAVQLALTAKRYRARHGKFPDKLDDLVPEFIAAVPQDPFDGKPMRMKRTEQGLRIYSIGADRVSKRGVWRKTQPGDIAFEVPDAK